MPSPGIIIICSRRYIHISSHGQTSLINSEGCYHLQYRFVQFTGCCMLTIVATPRVTCNLTLQKSISSNIYFTKATPNESVVSRPDALKI